MEIAGRFPGRVHSLVVHFFPVRTPSQTITCQTITLDLKAVNGLVAFHRPNLKKTTSLR